MENQTRRIAIVSAFAALYAALRFVPFSVVIGSPGAFFSFSDFLPLLYGILLGPYLGVLSVAIGTYVSFALARPPIFPEFLPFEFLPAAVNVLIVGFIFNRKKRNSFLIFSLILLAFGLHPFTLHLIPISAFGTSITFPFYWLHLVALVLLASPLVDRLVKRFREKQTGSLLSAMLLFAFIGTMSQHRTGGLLTEISKGNIARVLDPLLLEKLKDRIGGQEPPHGCWRRPEFLGIEGQHGNHDAEADQVDKDGQKDDQELRTLGRGQLNVS